MGFIVLASVAGITAILIHSITFITVKEPESDQGIERVGGSLTDAAMAIVKNKPFWLVFSATLIVGITTIFFEKQIMNHFQKNKKIRLGCFKLEKSLPCVITWVTF